MKIANKEAEHYNLTPSRKKDVVPCEGRRRGFVRHSVVFHIITAIAASSHHPKRYDAMEKLFGMSRGPLPCDPSREEIRKFFEWQFLKAVQKSWPTSSKEVLDRKIQKGRVVRRPLELSSVEEVKKLRKKEEEENPSKDF